MSGKRQKERGRERIPSQLHTQHEARHGAQTQDCEIMMWAKSRVGHLTHGATQVPWSLAICDNMNGPHGHYIKLNTSERERQIHLCVESKKQQQQQQQQKSKTKKNPKKTKTELLSTKNKLVVAIGGVERGIGKLGISGQKL